MPSESGEGERANLKSDPIHLVQSRMHYSLSHRWLGNTEDSEKNNKYINSSCYPCSFIGDKANDSIQAARATEKYWIETIQQRDELIASNNQSIDDLTRYVM